MMVILKSVSLSLTASVDQLIQECGFLPLYNRKAYGFCDHMDILDAAGGFEYREVLRWGHTP